MAFVPSVAHPGKEERQPSAFPTCTVHLYVTMGDDCLFYDAVVEEPRPFTAIRRSRQWARRQPGNMALVYHRPSRRFIARSFQSISGDFVFQIIPLFPPTK